MPDVDCGGTPPLFSGAAQRIVPLRQVAMGVARGERLANREIGVPGGGAEPERPYPHRGLLPGTEEPFEESLATLMSALRDHLIDGFAVADFLFAEGGKGRAKFRAGRVIGED